MSSHSPVIISLLILFFLCFLSSLSYVQSCEVLGYDLYALSQRDLSTSTSNYTYYYRACRSAKACKDGETNLCREARSPSSSLSSSSAAAATTASSSSTSDDTDSNPELISLSTWPSSSSSDDLHAIDTTSNKDLFNLQTGIGVVLQYTSWLSGCWLTDRLTGNTIYNPNHMTRVTVMLVCNPEASNPVFGMGDTQPCAYDASITTATLCKRKY